MQVALALQIPTSDGFITVALDQNEDVLRAFKWSVITRYELAAGQAQNSAERGFRERQLFFIRDTLNYLVPNRIDG